MYAANHWGGSLEITNDPDDQNRRKEDMDKASLYNIQTHQSGTLDETQQSWLLDPNEASRKKSKTRYVDLGCIVVKRKVLKWTVIGILVAFLVIGVPIIIAKSLPKHKSRPPPPDQYTEALHKALQFFNAQKSGKLPKNNGIKWRGNSGLKDGSDATDVKGGLVGGYYDAGDNTKFHFPMSFAMTMLSWSVIEYEHKYKFIEEYDHARELIKWGTDYLLRTFNSSATKIDHIYGQVGGSQNGSAIPDDHTCWERPEDMDYKRPIQLITAGADLAGEMAAALAAASIVFRDDTAYSKKLVQGAATVWTFARDEGKRSPYSRGNLFIEPYYNSTGYYDEYIWGSAWMYYATGNSSYLWLATNKGLSRHAKALLDNPIQRVLSWDNKSPAAMLLLTRIRMFLNPGFPYEDMLSKYQTATSLTMCSYLPRYQVFNRTRGGLIELSQGRPQNLQYVANAVFLTSLYADYLDAADLPGWNCGTSFVPKDALRNFANSKMDYILGKNPMDMSYVVGYGKKYPTHVHHRGASIPDNNIRYSCKGGFRWMSTGKPNPNTITGAMVGGPDRFDKFRDVRSNFSYTEPTLAGNAGLVVALASLTTTGGKEGVDKNSIFSAIPPLYKAAPPPPPPWKP
ncbi:endoglucanase 12-like [Cynara cardunculus var. scolymus]|uniref:endoglucanase 12-like n=1 Tax=Cynara cardunculus var. scolymus TaxID=59895 RepID=UPI000D625A4D|nr:endoglucanase 12-like [Cynara cardunculus var. scolymus]